MQLIWSLQKHTLVLCSTFFDTTSKKSYCIYFFFFLLFFIFYLFFSFSLCYLLIFQLNILIRGQTNTHTKYSSGDTRKVTSFSEDLVCNFFSIADLWKCTKFDIIRCSELLRLFLKYECARYENDLSDHLVKDSILSLDVTRRLLALRLLVDHCLQSKVFLSFPFSYLFWNWRDSVVKKKKKKKLPPPKKNKKQKTTETVWFYWECFDRGEGFKRRK